MRIIERRKPVGAHALMSAGPVPNKVHEIPDKTPDKIKAKSAESKEKVPAKEEDGFSKLNVSLANTPARVETLLKRLRAHEGNIGFDTEFAGASLRGTDFANITHCALLGVSVAFGKYNHYIPVRHKGNNISFTALDDIMGELASAAEQHRVWAHNAKVDHMAIGLDGYELPGLLCSMIAAWLVTGRNKGIDLKGLVEELFDRKVPRYDPTIHAKTGDEVKFYAGWDARNTLDLGEHFMREILDRDLRDWFIEECTFTHTLADMKMQGMRIDYTKLHALAKEAGSEQARILDEWNKLAPSISITSSKQLQELFVEGIWTPKGMTKGGAFSTEGKVMEYNTLNAKGDGKRLAQLRLDYQEVAKIVSTYSDELVEEARQWRDGRLHPDLWHFGTRTGRLSASGPNIQNQPARGQYAKLVREAFIPDPGHVFVSADYSQVELRYFAEYCGGTLLEAFLRGEDIHKRTARAMGCDRDTGKTVNFGFLLYGGAPEKLAKDVLKCSLQKAKDKIAALHATYPEVERWRQKIIQEADDSSATVPFVRTLAGRIRFIPELNPEYMRAKFPEEYAPVAKKYYDRCKIYGRKPKPNGEQYSVRSSGERLVVNYLIQGGARDLLVLGMNYFRHHMPKGWQIVTTVHDEVLVQVPETCRQHGEQLLKEALESAGPALGLKVPILAEPKSGYNWSEVK